VLTRKSNEKVLFPGLGIEVTIQRIAGNSVSVGVRAPKSVQILRGELANQSLHDRRDAPAPTTDRELLHAFRNQLNKAQLTVAIARKRLEQGASLDPEQTLREMLRQLTEIDRQLSAPALESTGREDVAIEDAERTARRALVVEDDANERALLAGYLRLCGFHTREAADGVEALAMLESGDVDVMVLDINMPRLDGRQTLEAIRRRSDLSHVKVFVVSGEDRSQSPRKEANDSHASWFAKPLNLERFTASLCASVN
jgi:carbon storage regulator CsrA